MEEWIENVTRNRDQWHTQLFEQLTLHGNIGGLSKQKFVDKYRVSNYFLALFSFQGYTYQHLLVLFAQFFVNYLLLTSDCSKLRLHTFFRSNKAG